MIAIIWSVKCNKLKPSGCKVKITQKLNVPQILYVLFCSLHTSRSTQTTNNFDDKQSINQISTLGERGELT